MSFGSSIPGAAMSSVSPLSPNSLWAWRSRYGSATTAWMGDSFSLKRIRPAMVMT